MGVDDIQRVGVVGSGLRFSGPTLGGGLSLLIRHHTGCLINTATYFYSFRN